MSNEIINPPTTSHSLPPGFSYFGNKARVRFDGNSLKQDKTVLTHEKNNEHTSFIYNFACLYIKMPN